MPIFEYSATNPEGRTVNGTVHGASMDAAARSLVTQGLQVTSLAVAVMPEEPRPASPAAPQTEGVAPQEAPPTTPRSRFVTDVAGPLVGQVPLTSLHFFFRQLSSMMHAGINPSDALDTLSHSTTSPKLRTVLRETRDHVVAGRPMSVGFQRYPEVFSPLILSLVRVGEQGGMLDEQFKLIADYLERDIALRNMIRRETFWPKVTVFFSILIILAANAVIASVAPGRQGLPTPTFIWIGATVFFAAWFIFVRWGLRIPAVKHTVDSILVVLPWFGSMVNGFAMAKFGRAFGALYKGGVAIPVAVKLAADACGNEAVRSKIYPAAQRLESGAGITETFAATGGFSRIVLDMTRTGETTGQLDQMLTKVAEYYEEEGQIRAQQATKVFGVITLLIVAIYVLYILFTFYSGYFGGMMGQANG
ncbi:MAG: type II secretion system F family protein [Fimbriimonadaceae bacterium]|nr:type II secretion system F family protein [Fimbriimonadaceae bacterium]QYK56275.1 MAG: type II secretion system F family protein [Fimbriimonadaceae bacterium]